MCIIGQNTHITLKRMLFDLTIHEAHFQGMSFLSSYEHYKNKQCVYKNLSFCRLGGILRARVCLTVNFVSYCVWVYYSVYWFRCLTPVFPEVSWPCCLKCIYRADPVVWSVCITKGADPVFWYVCMRKWDDPVVWPVYITRWAAQVVWPVCIELTLSYGLCVLESELTQLFSLCV